MQKIKIKDKILQIIFAKFVDYLGFDFVDIDWEHPTVSRDASGADEGCPGGPEDLKILPF